MKEIVYFYVILSLLLLSTSHDIMVFSTLLSALALRYQTLESLA